MLQMESSTNSILINECFETSYSDIYAAGDCCSVYLSSDDTKLNDNYHRHWFQMRLWSQARSMGIGAAHSIVNSINMEKDQNQEQNSNNSNNNRNETIEEFKERADNIWGGVMFQIFTHVTHLFDYKVVLLGCYNGQGLGEEIEKEIKEMVITSNGLIKEKYRNEVTQGKLIDSLLSDDNDNNNNTNTNTNVINKNIYHQANITNSSILSLSNIEIWVRVTLNEEYIKLIIQNNRIIGAMLIGDTDLEEVYENLILNELDISSYGMSLLDPDIDLEDYFD